MRSSRWRSIPLPGLKGYQIKYLAKRLQVEDEKDLCSLVTEGTACILPGRSALLVEINPLGLVDGKLVAMDSKFVIDGHARSICRQRWKSWKQARETLHRYKAPEKEADHHHLCSSGR